VLARLNDDDRLSQYCVSWLRIKLPSTYYFRYSLLSHLAKEMGIMRPYMKPTISSDAKQSEKVEHTGSRPFIPSGSGGTTFNAHALESIASRQAQHNSLSQMAPHSPRQAEPLQQAHLQPPTEEQRLAAAQKIQDAFRQKKSQALVQKFQGVVREAADTRREQLLSPLVKGGKIGQQTTSLNGTFAREYQETNGAMRQVNLFNRAGNLSESIDFDAHENGHNVSGHYHVAVTPGDISSSRGRGLAHAHKREAHYPAATMNPAIWTGPGAPPPMVTPGTVGNHNPKPDDPAVRKAQFGNLAAADQTLPAPASNTRAGSTHAAQRKAYLDKLVP
jgi:hypothetical protein